MELQVQVLHDADIATNVSEVSDHYLVSLEKYRGMVATEETLAEDKKTCAAIRKLKKTVSEQRIAFDRAVENLPCVKQVHDSLLAIEKKCDEMVDPYWQSVKAIEEAKKVVPDSVTTVDARIDIPGIPLKELDKIVKYITKAGFVPKVSVKNK